MRSTRFTVNFSTNYTRVKCTAVVKNTKRYDFYVARIKVSCEYSRGFRFSRVGTNSNPGERVFFLNIFSSVLAF